MMDIHKILKQLPHRYPLLLVDRVLTLDKGKYIPRDIRLSINVYAYGSQTYIRDTIADSIISTLHDRTKADSNGDTLATMALTVHNITSATRDTFLDQPEIIRIKEVMVTLRYHGG